MKTASEIEAWALDVLDRLQNGIFQEDSRVELKREINDPYKIARRVAAHCNAEKGETVLWIVGADEKDGAIGGEIEDPATLLPKIWKHIEGTPPVVTTVSVSFSGNSCLALAFTAQQVPYLVKNEAFGTKGHVIENEIPWRDGTRVRSARRDEIMRLLLNYSQSPQVEVISGEVSEPGYRKANESDDSPNVELIATIEFFLMPRSPAELVIPYHRITGQFSDYGSEAVATKFENIRFSCASSVSPWSIIRKNEPPRQRDDEIEIITSGSSLRVLCASMIEATMSISFPADVWVAFDRFSLELVLPVGPDRIPVKVCCDEIKKVG